MLKNWKTTLFGILTGGAYLFLSSMQGGVKPKDAAIATGVAVLGSLAKDNDVTGGTRTQ